MKFYLFYADKANAKDKNLPRVCSAVELNTIEDVLALRDRLENRLVFNFGNPYDYMDSPQEYLEFLKEEDGQCDDEYLVDPLPTDIDTTPTITVYNGYLD